MRILVHWQDFPGYAAACVASLRERENCETLVLFDRLNPNAPYDRGIYSGVGETADVTDWPASRVRDRIASFRPDGALVCGWVRYARIVARAAKRMGVRVVAICDNPPGRSLRQHLLPLAYRTYLKGIHDLYWVSGERSRRYLESAGVPASRIRTGVYAVEQRSLREAALERASLGEWPRRFLFVGQYIHRKGIDILLSAFAEAHTDWELRLCGSGPMADAVARAAGENPKIADLGFVEPWELPGVLAGSGALVLPSREDHWGLAILEAAAAGLPILCSGACGASEDLVEDGGNGVVVSPGDVDGLRSALETTAGRADDDLRQQGERSRRLAAPFDAAGWAETLVSMVRPEIVSG